MTFKIAIDCLVFAYDSTANELKLLLIRRNNEPAKDQWALPGGFVKETEEFVDTALRKLRQETGAKDIFLEQLKSYSLTDPSPENRIISIAFYALIRLENFVPSNDNDHLYTWTHTKNIPFLPFDHSQKVHDAIRLIKQNTRIKPLVFSLLPSKFTLNQLQKIYEEILDTTLDNRNFRRKVKGFKYIEPLHELEDNVSRRPGMLYSFNESEYILAASKLSVI